MKTGVGILIWDTAWFLGDKSTFIQSEKVEGLNIVSDLIDAHEIKWKADLVRNTFTSLEAQQIRCIPLSHEKPTDKLSWCPEKAGEYTVRSDYRLLLRGFSGSEDDKYKDMEPHMRLLYKSL